jgi:protein involved in polysaccharide export with SLBB domain
MSFPFDWVYHRHQTEEQVTMLESKTFRVWMAAALLMCAISCGKALSAQETQHSIAAAVDTYWVGVGDQIQVDVWRHPEISKTVVVDRKGNITLPSVHVVKASGLSAQDLANLVRHKLERKIPNPQVTVTVVRISNHLAPLPQRSLQPLRPPSPQLRDTPSPEQLLHDCCVAREGL